MKRPNNANMWQKSLLQQYREYGIIKENAKQQIQSLLDKYTVENNVFGFPNGKFIEVEEGYFVTESEFDNLNDAIREMDTPLKYIRVNENKFMIGYVKNSLSDCETDKEVFDIANQSVINF